MAKPIHGAYHQITTKKDKLMENTTIIVYGASKQDSENIIEQFDWKLILSGSELVTASEFNDHIFEFENRFSVSAHEKFVCVHPGNTTTVEKMTGILKQAVSNYYHCNCSVSGTNSHLTVDLYMNIT